MRSIVVFMFSTNKNDSGLTDKKDNETERLSPWNIPFTKYIKSDKATSEYYFKCSTVLHCDVKFLIDLI